MSAVDELYHEHKLMFRTLAALEQYLLQLEAQPGVDMTGLQRFSEFFMHFADNHHAEKEESVLLPALEGHGEGWAEGPLANSRREHRKERYLMRVIAQDAARGGITLDSAARSHLIASLREFIDSMSKHMRFEEEHLFPLAQRLKPSETSALEAAAARFDEQSEQQGELSTQRESAEALWAQYAPPNAQAPEAGAGSGSPE